MAICPAGPPKLMQPILSQTGSLAEVGASGARGIALSARSFPPHAWPI
jgi:hypothetical protein